MCQIFNFLTLLAMYEAEIANKVVFTKTIGNIASIGILIKALLKIGEIIAVARATLYQY
jgi:hypothetical protein